MYTLDETDHVFLFLVLWTASLTTKHTDKWAFHPSLGPYTQRPFSPPTPAFQPPWFQKLPQVCWPLVMGLSSKRTGALKDMADLSKLVPKHSSWQTFYEVNAAWAEGSPLSLLHCKGACKVTWTFCPFPRVQKIYVNHCSYSKPGTTVTALFSFKSMVFTWLSGTVTSVESHILNRIEMYRALCNILWNFCTLVQPSPRIYR